MKHITLNINQLPEMELDNIVTAYIGRPHECMCGCAGNYYYTKANQERGTKRRGYEVKDEEVDDKKVEYVWNKMNKNAQNGVEVNTVDGGFIFSIVIGKTQYTMYTV